MTAHTLLLRLAGPMQSWGSRSRFGERDTEREPTKSGVIGLLCAALGRPRDAAVADLAALRFGVRVDREGRIERDYHTALDVRKADPKASPRVGTVVSTRFYLADAAFLVGLESPDLGFLEHLDRALTRPRWPLYLGRKAFVPGEPVRLPDGMRRGEHLEAALTAYPAGGSADFQASSPGTLRLVLECTADEHGELRTDVPLSFASDDRRFGVRRVRTAIVPRAVQTPESEGA